MKKIARVVVAMACLAVCGYGRAADIETKVKQVALFKNGYAFFLREGELPKGDKTVVLDHVPRASLGTLWMGTAGSDARVVDAKVIKRSAPIKRPAMNHEEFIRSNPGREVLIAADNDEFTGTLLPVPEDYEYPDAPPFEPARSGRYYGPRGPVDPNMRRAEVFMIRTPDDEIVTIKFAAVRQLTVRGSAVTEFEEQREEPALECTLDKAARKGSIGMHYLEAGASWIPGYEISLADEKTAVVRLKGTLVNDVEDLEDAEVRFVVGYPNFMYKDLHEPMTGRESLHQFLEGLVNIGNERERHQRGMMMQQSISSNIAMFEDSYAAMPAMPTGGEFKEDLFFYPPVKASVKRGERLSFVISESESPYRHVYTWDVPDTISVDQYGQHNRNAIEGKISEIWHSLELENKAKQPWTTGSALIVRDGLPLGQDMMKYTPAGGDTLVRITRATDVTGQKQEIETERERNAKTFYHNQYDRVTVRGELKIRNTRTEPVHVTITKTTTGDVLETSPEGEVTVRAEGLTPVNQKSTIKWDIDLEPGDEQKLEYVVEVYVRS